MVKLKDIHTNMFF